MTAAWVLYVLFVGTLLAAAALAVDGAMRQAQRPTRFVWAAALAAYVAFALLAPGQRAAAPVASASAADANAVAATPAPAGPIWIVAVVARAIDDATSLVTQSLARAARRAEALSTPFAVLWALASLAIVGLLVGVNRRLDRARRGWPLERVHGTDVRVAPQAGPAVIGLSRPEIVLPRWLLSRSDEDQRLVVSHEREHLMARDQWVLTGGWMVAALLPWHPAVWWMLARLRLAMELDCDARVLRRDVARARYGTLLIDIAGQCAGLRIGAIALADRTTHLERRLLAMSRSKSRFTPARAAGLIAVAALLAVVACESRVPTQAEVTSMDAASAERSAVRAKLVAENGAGPVFTVDGAAMPAENAKAIPAERIASVVVAKGQGTEPSVIAITTKAAGGESSVERMKIAGVVTPDEAKRIAEREEASAKPLPSKEPFHGLLMIDGVVSTAGLTSLDPKDIEKVEILKGDAAKAESSDPAAQFGIIRITTKKHATP